MWGDYGPGDVGLQAGDDGEYAGQVPDVAAAFCCVSVALVVMSRWKLGDLQALRGCT